MDFIDPTTLEIGSTYTISKETPIMPNYELKNIQTKMIMASEGAKISITDRKKVGNTVWYKISSDNVEGWINSIALFGQKLK